MKNANHDLIVPFIAGHTREVKSADCSRHLYVAPHQDLATRFVAWDVHWGQYVEVNGWEYVFKDVEVAA
jgi:hypothetical protein